MKIYEVKGHHQGVLQYPGAMRLSPSHNEGVSPENQREMRGKANYKSCDLGGETSHSSYSSAGGQPKEELPSSRHQLMTP